LRYIPPRVSLSPGLRTTQCEKAFCVCVCPSSVQQSSFYGYMGMLPKRYTQGVMTGESKSCHLHYITVYSIHLRYITVYSIHLRYITVYSIHLRYIPVYSIHLRYITVYSIHLHYITVYPIHLHYITGNGVVATTSPSDDVTDEFQGGTYVRFGIPKDKIRRSWPGLRDMFLHRYIVARVIWAYMLSIAVTYSITLCLFPGLESEIRNPTLGEWLPILIMATFNMADFVGKILAALPYEWTGSHLLLFSCLRVVFIPLLVMCVYPSSTPTLSHPAWPCLFSLLMGVTNGYFGSVPMIQAAGKVPPEQRELAGEGSQSISTDEGYRGSRKI
uniref:Solute carrier family 29 member 4 n=1 Tax=Hucho hucho TaxID=62062 RepID=A0A4W5JNI9_9TELE